MHRLYLQGNSHPCTGRPNMKCQFLEIDRMISLTKQVENEIKIKIKDDHMQNLNSQ